jgi:hypothetical protein
MSFLEIGRIPKRDSPLSSPSIREVRGFASWPCEETAAHLFGQRPPPRSHGYGNRLLYPFNETHPLVCCFLARPPSPMSPAKAAPRRWAAPETQRPGLCVGTELCFSLVRRPSMSSWVGVSRSLLVACLLAVTASRRGETRCSATVHGRRGADCWEVRSCLPTMSCVGPAGGLSSRRVERGTGGNLRRLLSMKRASQARVCHRIWQHAANGIYFSSELGGDLASQTDGAANRTQSFVRVVSPAGLRYEIAKASKSSWVLIRAVSGGGSNWTGTIIFAAESSDWAAPPRSGWTAIVSTVSQDTATVQHSCSLVSPNRMSCPLRRRECGGLTWGPVARAWWSSRHPRCRRGRCLSRGDSSSQCNSDGPRYVCLEHLGSA